MLPELVLAVAPNTEGGSTPWWLTAIGVVFIFVVFAIIVRNYFKK